MLFPRLLAKCRGPRGELPGSGNHERNGVWVPEYSKKQGMEQNNRMGLWLEQEIILYWGLKGCLLQLLACAD